MQEGKSVCYCSGRWLPRAPATFGWQMGCGVDRTRPQQEISCFLASSAATRIRMNLSHVACSSAFCFGPEGGLTMQGVEVYMYLIYMVVCKDMRTTNQLAICTTVVS